MTIPFAIPRSDIGCDTEPIFGGSETITATITSAISGARLPISRGVGDDMDPIKFRYLGGLGAIRARYGNRATRGPFLENATAPILR